MSPRGKPASVDIVDDVDTRRLVDRTAKGLTTYAIIPKMLPTTTGN
ncbi:hypothetical protein EDF46_3453 [Frondihabitans sp. PhB188]|nr:hypothetical protein EDF46_3453 [Frondihabitans sp. PhB188]